MQGISQLDYSLKHNWRHKKRLELLPLTHLIHNLGIYKNLKTFNRTTIKKKTKKQLINLNSLTSTAIPANICLGERRLQRNIFCPQRRLQDIIARRLKEHVLQIRPEDVLRRCFGRLQKRSCKHVLKTSWKMKKSYAKDVFKTSSRTLGKQKIFAGQQTFILVKTYWRRLQRNIFLSSKTSWRHN